MLDTRDASGARPQITDQMDTWRESVVISENPEDLGFDLLFWICRLLAELMERHYGVKVGPTTIDTYLKYLGLSYQQPDYQAREIDPYGVYLFSCGISSNTGACGKNQRRYRVRR